MSNLLSINNNSPCNSNLSNKKINKKKSNFKNKLQLDYNNLIDFLVDSSFNTQNNNNLDNLIGN